MYSFALILTLFAYGDIDSKYAINTSMAGEDCVAALQHQQALLAQTFSEEDFELACVIDFDSYP